MTAPNRKPIINGPVAIVPLTQGLFAVIDAEDAEKVGRHTWRAAKHHGGGFYAHATARRLDGSWYTLALHRYLMPGELAGPFVDHANGNPLDNRKANLRVATRAQNQANQGAQRSNLATGLKGVTRNGKGFAAKVGVGGRQRYFGTYSTPELAWIAASIAREHLHGAFANHGADPFHRAAMLRFTIACQGE